ncbi:MAG TPA: response regulator transcription factor [Polyangia bacterium]|nr:response regulator transcription factor [Polyangia bacterium]
MSLSSVARVPLIGLGLRTIVVTLDPGCREPRAGSLAAMLRALGHEVVVSGYDLIELAPCLAPVDVIIVEAKEHLEIGRQAIQRLRQRPELIAARILLCLEVGRVVALTAEMGADDFILMPATPDELAARLWQLKARDSRPRAALQLRYGDIVLDCEMRQAYRSDQSLTLTSFEFQLLRFLIERVSRVFTRQELLTRVWGYRHEGTGRSVDTHILNLRRKLGDLGERLQAVIGVGYKLQRLDLPLDRPSSPPAHSRAARSSRTRPVMPDTRSAPAPMRQTSSGMR